MKLQSRKHLNYFLLLVISLHCINTPILYAQYKVDKEWEFLNGSPRRDEALSVMETIDNGFIIIGVTWSFGNSDGARAGVTL